MFCPRCGQERVSEATSFCSRCGFLLTGVAELVASDGKLMTAAVGQGSPRSRGVRMGIFIFLLTFLVAPIIGMISVFGLNIEPWPMGIAVFLLGAGGLLRIAYALMFESKLPKELPSGTGSRSLPFTGSATAELPPSSYQPPLTAETLLRTRPEHEPASVTDDTTKLLEKD